jgi:hypothetical protein
MWTYLFGPILAIFPKPWRNLLPFADDVQWARATAISGLVELVIAIVAVMQWYSFAMSTWVGNGVGVALSGKMGHGEVRIQDIGAAALFVWWMHPLTWLLAFLGLEGAVRLCAGAFGEHPCGILPLFLADKILFGPFRVRKRDPDDRGGNVASYVGAIRERLQAAALPESSDEICFTRDGAAEVMEIRASRKKRDWIPPRIVRYLDAYYRLEDESSEFGARPFRYRLRRLAAGVPGRNVLLYTPANAVIRESSLR